MRNVGKPNTLIDVDGQAYNERHLAQIIRRKMMSKVYKDKTKYNRKQKHKQSNE